MKIVHVVTLVSATGAFGGPTTLAIEQLSELARRGHAVRLCGLHDGLSAPAIVDGVPVTLYRNRQIVPRVGIVGQMNAALLPKLWREIRAADLVHVHTGRDLVSLTALVVCWVTRRPFVTQTHGMVMPSSAIAARVFDTMLRPLLRRARARLILTDVEARGVSEVCGAPTVQLNNGVARRDPDVRVRSRQPEILFLARLHARKRPLLFIEMAEKLEQRGARMRYVLAGPDEGEVDAVRARIAELDGRLDITYVGALDHQNAVSRLAGADVYVLPSVDEPFPMTILEAMSEGTPVVCTDTCGIAPELGTSDGARVTDGSADQLAAAVLDLGDPRRWADRSAAARELASNEFSISVVVDRLEGLYTAACSAR